MLVGSLPLRCTDEELEGNGGGEDEELFLYGLTSWMRVLLESGVRVTAIPEGRERRIRAFYAAINVAV